MQGYLPAQLSAAEVDALIDEAIAQSGASSIKEMGKAMALLKQKAQGRTDMAAAERQAEEQTRRLTRPQDTRRTWRKKDPTRRFERCLIKIRALKKEDLRRINQEVEAEVKDAHSYAKFSPYPNPNELTKYVFKE